MADLIGEADAESKEETTHNEHGEVLGGGIQAGTKKEWQSSDEHGNFAAQHSGGDGSDEAGDQRS